jgi:GxxExxY protein
MFGTLIGDFYRRVEIDAGPERSDEKKTDPSAKNFAPPYGHSHMGTREPTSEENEIARLVLDAAYYVHTKLGPGLTEKVYEACMAHALKKRGLAARRQLTLPVYLDGERVDCGLRLDLFVNDAVIVEIKTVDAIHPLHLAQMITYLRMTERCLGLILNFNVPMMKDGVKRVVNSRPPWEYVRAATAEALGDAAAKATLFKNPSDDPTLVTNTAE